MYDDQPVSASNRRWFDEHVAIIQVMFDTPATKDNYHEWDTSFIRDGVMVSARLYVHGPRHRVDMAFFQSSGFIDGPDLNAADVAAWMGLDHVDPSSMMWRHKRLTVNPDLAIAKTLPPMPGGMN